MLALVAGFVACNNDDDKNNGGGTTSAYDVEFEAKRFEGEFYGTEYSTTNNYWLFLSDKGLKTDSNGKVQYDPEGTYYYFDCYSELAPENEALPIIPNGTYAFDAENSCAAGTFAKSASGCKRNGEGLAIESGEIVVSDNKVDILLTMANGEKHHITYEGDLAVNRDLSTFVEDREFNIQDAAITITNYGNENFTGINYWCVEAVKGEDYFILDLFNNNASSAHGFYTNITATTSSYNNTFLPGSYNGSLSGCWYAKLTGDKIKGDSWAPMMSGLIRVEQSGDKVTISYGCMDDAGNNITGSVSGTIAQ